MKGLIWKCSFKIYIILVSIIVLSSCAVSKYKVGKTTLEKHFEINPVFRESHTGLMVYDPELKEVIFNYNAHKHFTPASNTKLITYFSMISLLKDSIPSLKYWIKNDTLYFTGTGDGTLLYSEYDYGKAYNFLRDCPYPLVYVKKPLTDQRFGPGWAWDDYPYYFSVEKAALPIYGNLMKISKDSTDQTLHVTPPFFEDDLSIIHDENASGIDLTRDEFENTFTLKFNHLPSSFEEEIPFIYSDEHFTQLLSDTLHRPISLTTRIPGGHFEILNSIPTDSVAKKILIESDNFLAEQTLLLISNQIGDTLSSDKSIEFVMENYLSELKEEIYWVDGSGLSRYNLVTPNAMIKVLEHIYHMVPKEKIYHLLPESGKSGTLKKSFTGLGGSIHAKTGSMSHVYNISGYLETKSGKTLLFSFMNNNFNVSFSELKGEMERVLSVFVNDMK